MSTQSTTAPVTASVAKPTTMRSARGLAFRGIRNIRRLPSAFFPAMAMPVFTMIAFAGTFAAITQLPGFPTDRSVNWFMPLGICFGAAFSGIGLGFSTIRDIETRFYGFESQSCARSSYQWACSWAFVLQADCLGY